MNRGRRRRRVSAQPAPRSRARSGASSEQRARLCGSGMMARTAAERSGFGRECGSGPWDRPRPDLPGALLCLTVYCSGDSQCSPLVLSCDLGSGGLTGG